MKRVSHRFLHRHTFVTSRLPQMLKCLMQTQIPAKMWKLKKWARPCVTSFPDSFFRCWHWFAERSWEGKLGSPRKAWSKCSSHQGILGTGQYQQLYRCFMDAGFSLTSFQAVVPILLQGMSALVKERSASLHVQSFDYLLPLVFNFAC